MLLGALDRFERVALGFFPVAELPLERVLARVSGGARDLVGVLVDADNDEGGQAGLEHGADLLGLARLVPWASCPNQAPSPAPAPAMPA